jgi:hypothetical protein
MAAWLTAAGVIAASTTALAQPMAVPAAAASAAQDFRGVWMQEGGGRWPEFRYTDEYRKIYHKRLADQEAGVPFDDPAGRCITSGMPRVISTGAYPWEISQTLDHITMIKENLGSSRRIFLKRGHDTSNGITYMGDSTGRWEGDTLVIDTISVRGDTLFDLLAPHSDKIHFVERVRKLDADTLEWTITADDAKALRRPVTATMTYKRHPDWELAEYVCDNNRNTFDANGKPVILANPNGAEAPRGKE